MDTESRFFPLGLAAAYIFYSICVRIVVEVFTGVVLVATLWPENGDLTSIDLSPESLEGALNATLLGGASAFQLILMGVGAIVAARFLGGPTRENLSLRRSSALGLAVGAIGGCTVGFFPGWLAYQLSEALPWLDMGNLSMLNTLLLEADLIGKFVMIFAICFCAPLFEELVFRGFLWEALAKVIPGWAVWLVTSTAFALYHVDPIHVAAVFFTGLFLGWVRWRSGSIYPAILAHLANNGLAAITVFAGVAETQTEPSLALALVGAAITLGLAASLLFTRRDPSEEITA